MNRALQPPTEFAASTADGFPLGTEGCTVLDQIERVSKLLEETNSFYKAQSAKDPRCVPGWQLKPGALRRSLGNAQQVWARPQ